MNDQNPGREEIYDEMTAHIKGDKATGEWTASTIREILDALGGRSDIHPHHAIADAHNAAIAADREKHESYVKLLAEGQDRQDKAIQQLRARLAESEAEAQVKGIALAAAQKAGKQ